jgi:hypothetical protein
MDADARIDAYKTRYGALLDEIRSDVEEFSRPGGLSSARTLSEATGQQFSHATWPLYFTGDLDAALVLVHLNPRVAPPINPADADPVRFASFEEYFDFHRFFGRRHYGPDSDRRHISPFDHKQIRFLRPFRVIDFVDEHDQRDRYTNLERVVDHKLQMELIPYGSPAFSTRGFTARTLASHWERLIGVLSAGPRRFVVFCGSIFETIVGDHVTDYHEFLLTKNDGTPTRQKARYANLAIPNPRGGVLHAGLAYSFARQGIPMTDYGRRCHSLYRATEPDQSG